MAFGVYVFSLVVVILFFRGTDPFGAVPIDFVEVPLFLGICFTAQYFVHRDLADWTPVPILLGCCAVFMNTMPLGMTVATLGSVFAFTLASFSAFWLQTELNSSKFRSLLLVVLFAALIDSATYLYSLGRFTAEGFIMLVAVKASPAFVVIGYHLLKGSRSFERRKHRSTEQARRQAGQVCSSDYGECDPCKRSGEAVRECPKDTGESRQSE